MNIRLYLLAWCLIAFFGIGPAWSAPQSSVESFRRNVKKRVNKDQAARYALLKFNLGLSVGKPQTKASRSKYQRLVTRASDVDASNAEWLKKYVSKFGLPSAALLGKDSAEGLLLLLVHADRDRELQKKCVELMEASPAEWPDSYAQRLKLRTTLAPPSKITFPKKEKKQNQPNASNKATEETAIPEKTTIVEEQ